MAKKPRQAFPDAPSGATPPAAPAPRRAPMFAKGAASLDTAVKSAAAEDRMYRNLPVALIDPSLVRDRIDVTEDLETLKESLASEGQQIPILVRPKPGTDRYEIVTGRRRLQAMKELGRDTIQAFVRQMSDEDAFVAQGVENNARLETSFIERARTILSALEAGFTQTQVEKFLGVDQTMISRMKTIYSGIGEDLVLAIGPARGIGRRKWERLQKHLAAAGSDTEGLLALVPGRDIDSAERFDAFLGALERTGRPAPRRKAAAKSEEPPAPVSATRRGRQLVVRTTEEAPDGFLDHLAERLPDLLAEYRRSHGETE